MREFNEWLNVTLSQLEMAILRVVSFAIFILGIWAVVQKFLG